MPELVHAWAETLDGQVSRGRCGVVTLTYLFSRDGRETCPQCKRAESVPNGTPHEAPEPMQVVFPDAVERERRIKRLRAAIAQTGLSNSAYAREVLVRDPRSLRRWLAGDAPIPRQVLKLLELG